jgi:hypothetical protein
MSYYPGKSNDNPNISREEAYLMLEYEYQAYIKDRDDCEDYTLEDDINSLWEQRPWNPITIPEDEEPWNDCWWLSGRYLGHL